MWSVGMEDEVRQQSGEEKMDLGSYKADDAVTELKSAYIRTTPTA